MAKNTESQTSRADLFVAIQDLLRKGKVGTQEDIRAAMAKQGITLNQARISRVLHKLGAIKINEGEEVVYRLPTELVSITPNDSLRQLILSVTHNESLIVIQTAPGSAHLVARFLDLKNDFGILGTVAGDDTIFVAPEKIKNIALTCKKIHQLLLG
jgi:transcriptional regulator of arginine metabolism